MNSPAKRRKTNKDETRGRPNGNLDFFFGSKTQHLKKPTGDDTSTAVQDASVVEESELTDEQLARKLQREWDERDKLPDAAAALPSSQTSIATPGPIIETPDDQNEPTLSQSREIEQSKDLPSPSTETTPMIPATEDSVQAGKHTLSLQSVTASEDTVSQTIPFDQSPLTFDASEYLPQLKRQWGQEGGSATYALLTRCFVLVNSTQSRIRIVDNLVNLLRVIIEGDPESLLSLVWLATNSISPPYIDLELGLGGSAISKALKKVCGLDSAGLKKLYDKHGDAGDVAFEAKKRQSLTLRKPKPLSIRGVFDSLVKIANSKGQGSQENKQRIVERLVQDARGAEESRYIVRTLVQHLRIGAVKTTMLIALSRAFLLSRAPHADYAIEDRSRLSKLRKEDLAEVWSKSEEVVKACFARRPNYNDLVPTLLEVGVCEELLIRCGLALHIPLRPMLGNITRDLGDMLSKLEGRNFSCEYKYDGQRAQVHCDGSGKVTIFSRHLEVMTEKYPDLVALVPQIRGEGVSSFILEGEVVAVDRDTGDLKPFQTLANRARKDVAIETVKVDVCLFSFDLMYLNGQELLGRPFRERRELLRSLFKEIPHHFTRVKNLDATPDDAEAVSDFFKSATDVKCEGVMVKILDSLPDANFEQNAEADLKVDEATPATPSKSTKMKKSSTSKGKSGSKIELDKTDGVQEVQKKTRRKTLLATYEPDKRVDSWLKVKKDYNSEASETLDLVPVAGWHGQGRKAKWWSPILLAVRNPETGCLEAVTKCISGFTDKFYAANKEKYAEDGDNVISRPSYVEYPGSPDVWFEPQEVWEISFADITLSPTYTAAMGLVSDERGLSTRFPRFLKVREDKHIEEATTSDYLATLWRKQEAKAPAADALDQSKGGAADESPNEEVGE
ncbi:MAG: hypothetical protein M1831_006527 [Alyxoria varia]|nr:MAG: hypothetical protein M1831_006527 [Alyxoria varia]